jgi:hypothetical protein
VKTLGKFLSRRFFGSCDYSWRTDGTFYRINNFPSSTIATAHLEHLQRITFRGFGREGVHIGDELENGSERLLPLLDNIVKTSEIHSLAISSSLLWKLPIRTFESLTCLEITQGKDLQNMLLVFHHAARLQSLTFVDLNDDQLFKVLGENPSILPRLTSFKAMGYYPESRHLFLYSNSDFSQLAEFLRTKTELRRLDVHLMCYKIGPLMEVLRDLPSLRILGLFTGINLLTREDYLQLVQVLPPHLTALRLSTRWEFTPENRAAADALVSSSPWFHTSSFSERRLSSSLP